MKNIVLIFFSCLLLLGVVAPVLGAQRNFFEANSVYVAKSPVTTETTLTFEQMGLGSPISLRGNLATAKIGFGSRLDEIITAAKIHVTYNYSPALSPLISHVRVLINKQVAGYFAVDPALAGKSIEQTIQFDSRFLSKYNEVSFELLSYRELQCGTQAIQSMWFDISNQSTLTLTAQSIALKSDLSLFPKPFVDTNDLSNVDVPFVFPENATDETLEAAGIIASYFGKLADWRNFEFSSLINELPTKHAIVFATNDKRPSFLRDLPPVNAPVLQIITHPNNAFVKLLLVLGRDKADLRKAAQGLVTGYPVLGGTFAEVTEIKELLPRQPYDAPHWIPTNREVKFGELVQDLTQLQSKGRTPSPILVNFNIAPDLFTWRSRGIPLNIKYRYSPPNKGDDSQLSIKVNNSFVKGLPLNKSGVSDGTEKDRIRIKLVDDLLFGIGNEVLMPGFHLGGKNTLEFDYEFTKPEGGDCQELTPNYMYGEIDADSTLDLTGFPHYIAMPDLKAFSNIGFPYTRFANLADTAVIINKNATTNEIEAYLNIMGLFGSSTGLAGTQVTVQTTTPFEGIENKNLLIIGYAEAEKIDVSEEKKFHSLVKEIKKVMTVSVRGDTEFTRTFQPDSLRANRVMSKEVAFNNRGEVGALVAFESPWGKNNSVVAIIASEPSVFKKITTALNQKSQKIFGSVALFRGDEVVNIQVGETYYVGHLPIYQLILFELSDNPVLLGFLTFLMIALMIVVIWRLLKYIAWRRLNRHYE